MLARLLARGLHGSSPGALPQLARGAGPPRGPEHGEIVPGQLQRLRIVKHGIYDRVVSCPATGRYGRILLR